MFSSVAARTPLEQITALTSSRANVRAYLRGEEKRKSRHLKQDQCVRILDFRYRAGNIQCQVEWESFDVDGKLEPSLAWEDYREAVANDSFVQCLRSLTDKSTAVALDWELPEDKAEEERLRSSSSYAKNIIERQLPNFDDLEFHCYSVLYSRAVATGFVGPNFLTAFLERRRLHRFHHRRLKQIAGLAALSKRLTEMAGVSVIFENRIDFDQPMPFNYVSECFSNDILIPDDPIIGCGCRSCNVHRECCPNLSGSSFPYDRDGTLRLARGKAVYECNKRCRCDNRCMNRVVQHGPTVPFVVFKTRDRGWGLRATVPLKSGQFVCEYVGEVVDSNTADNRGKQYDHIGLTYLFDLDYNNAEKPYTVDAYEYGNMSRFMNHSCDPNCAIWVVYINCLDPNLPRLGIFTRRSLDVGEELTFDYNVGSGPELEPVAEEESSLRTLTRIGQCFCKTKKCRQYLFDAVS